MLVLTLGRNRSFYIDNDIKVTILEVGERKVKVGITAPKYVSIRRDNMKDDSNEREGSRTGNSEAI